MVRTGAAEGSQEINGDHELLTDEQRKDVEGGETMPRQRKPGGTGEGLPQINVRLEPSYLNWIDTHAGVFGLTRQEYIRKLIQEEYLFFNRFLRDLRERLWDHDPRDGEPIPFTSKLSLCEKGIEDSQAEYTRLEKLINAEEAKLRKYLHKNPDKRAVSLDLACYKAQLNQCERRLKYLRHKIKDIMEGMEAHGPEYDTIMNNDIEYNSVLLLYSKSPPPKASKKPINEDERGLEHDDFPDLSAKDLGLEDDEDVPF